MKYNNRCYVTLTCITIASLMVLKPALAVPKKCTPTGKPTNICDENGSKDSSSKYYNPEGRTLCEEISGCYVNDDSPYNWFCEGKPHCGPSSSDRNNPYLCKQDCKCPSRHKWYKNDCKLKVCKHKYVIGETWTIHYSAAYLRAKATCLGINDIDYTKPYCSKGIRRGSPGSYYCYQADGSSEDPE